MRDPAPPSKLQAWGSEILGVGNDGLVLASASPRRAELLTQVGVPFVRRPVTVDETLIPGADGSAEAERLAVAKAQRAFQDEDAWVVGADTLVLVDGTVLGKPRDSDDARRMLAMLSGREHTVVTGVAVLHGPEKTLVSGRESTRVWIRDLLPEDIGALVNSEESLDKAGGYGIQGLAALMIEGIEGDYFNVMGLPLGLLRRLVRKAGGR